MIEAIEKYNITADALYNFDEKGFLIGMTAAIKRIMTLEAYESGRITHASHDGSREFISLLACICANGTALPPALIYRGEAIQDSWLEDWNNEQAFFASSSTGWSSDEFGYQWLTQIFDRCTKKHLQRRRLLIVDGHSSHVNLKFINKCDELRILLMILPSHTTHRLQPLDVSLFAPLARYYTNGLNAMMNNSLGTVSMSKRAFWSIFWPAWQQAFTAKNIASGFKRTGIFPFDSDAVLNQIIKKKLRASPPENIDDTQAPKTPMTGRAVRRIQKVYEKQPTRVLLSKIFTANQRLAAKESINQHVIRGLLEALKNEKKRRNRGKKLNLLGEEDSGPQFFSPGRVQAARAYQASKDEEKSRRQEDINEKRAQAAVNKTLKEQQKQQRALAAAERRRLNAEVKQAKAVEKQAQNELRSAANRPKQLVVRLKLPSTGPNQVDNDQMQAQEAIGKAVVPEGGEGAISTTSRGRRVRAPRHFGA